MKRLFSTLLLLLGITVGANAQDMTATPLTFEAVEAGTITVMYGCFGDAPSGNINPIQYKLNDGSWTDVTWNTDIELAANDVISFHGDNVSCYDSENWEHIYFVCSNDCYLYGNVMSLLSTVDFATMTSLTEEYCFSDLFCNQWTKNTTIKNHPTYDIVLPATTLTDYCYNSMFYGCAGLTRAPELPATTMTEYCYNDMFNGCTNLVAAPALPAMALAEGCYTFMFWGCTSLTIAPELPATTLVNMCYDGIFMECTSLVNAPELPATILVSGCYSEMFMGCTSLETAPVLPAETLVDYCYNMMFNGCTSLNSVTCLATDISAEGCTFEWLAPVDGGGEMVSNGTFYKASGMENWEIGISGIPEGWTVQDYTPYDSYITPLTLEAVQAGTITIENPNALTIEYNKNGTGWTSANTDLISITVAAGDMVQFRGDNASYWASGDSGETVTRFTASNSVYVYGNIMSLIDKDDFATNTTLTEEFALAYLFAAPSSDFYQFYALNSTIMNHPDKDLVLPATTLTGTCYGYMFAGCEGLTRAPELPATTLAMGCYHRMFADCSGLTEAPSLPATTLADMCYSSMFYNCTSLTTAPDLLATALVEGCYMGMFDGCSNLNYVRCLATSVYETDCTTDWLNGVAEEGTFIKVYGMWDWSTGANGIPVGWTVEEDLTTAPLTIEAVEDETVVTITNTNSLYLRVSIQYGSSTSGFSTNQKTYTQTLPAGASMSIKLHAQTGTNAYSSNFTVTASKDVYVYGNLLSLVFSSFSNKTDLTGCADGVLEGLFCLGYEGNELNPHIKNHPTKDIVLPATTLSNGCYMAMFSGCTGLTRAPELPATILSEDCYHRMFEYSGLTQAPVLPAATMIGQCYGGMFDHCSNLNYVRCMATDLGENNGEVACGDWLKDVAATGTFVKAPGMDSWTVGPQEPGGLIYGIPEGWITCDKVFQTAGNWNVAANWNTGAVPAAGSDVVIAANVIVPDECVADAGNVFIEEGNTLTIADGGQLKHSNEVQGTIQKFITGYVDVTNPGGYYLLGAPLRMDSTLAVSSGMLDLVDGHADFDTHGIDLYEFSQGLELEWKNMRWGDNLEKMGITAKGACLYARFDDATLNFSTTEYNGFVPTSVDDLILVVRSTNTPEPEFIGWNLIRNPFTCNAYLASGRDFYRMNASGDAIVLATNENDGLAIKPCEGIFVVVAAENDPDPYILPNPNTGEPITVSNLAQIRFTATEPQPNGRGMLDIKVKQEGQIADVARVRFGEGNRMGKLTLRDNATRLSIMRDSKDYSVVYEEAQGEMPLSFKAAKNGTYTLSVNPESVELEYLHLIDNMTGTDVDLLAEQSYTFTSKTTDYASRFRLVFSANDASIGSASDETFAFVNDGDIIITGDIENTTVQVIDVTGRIVRTVGLLHHGSRITTVGMTPGVYVLRLINGDDVKTQKMVID